MARVENRFDDAAGAGSRTDVRAGDPTVDFDRQVDTFRAAIEKRVDQLAGAFDHSYQGTQLHSWKVGETFQQGGRNIENTYIVSVSDGGAYPRAYRTEEAHNGMGYRYERTRHMNSDGSLGGLSELVVGDQRDWFRVSSGNRVLIVFAEDGTTPARIEYRATGERDLVQLTRSVRGWTVDSDHPEKNVGWHMHRIGEIVNARKAPQGATRTPYMRLSNAPLGPKGLKV